MLSTTQAIWLSGITITKNLGYAFTSECMANALFKGGDRTYYNESAIFQKIKSEPKFQNLVNDWVNEYKRVGKRTFYDGLEFEPSGNKDLYYALQHVDISAVVENNGNLLVTITDKYDFDRMRAGLSLGPFANNYGLLLQTLGELTPFYITVKGYCWAGTIPSTSPNTSGLLRLGSKGSDVTRLQQALISKGYSCGSAGADGDFGQGTYNAVISFQKAKGLGVDGIVGPATWNALSNSGNTSSLLKLGSKGSDVTRLQQALISKGYSCGSAGADGDFGQGTYNAVTSFQRAKGLDVDGIVGPMTWNVLNSSGSNSNLLKLGSKGSDVTRLQQALIARGYSCGSAGADGDFGQGTYNAIVSFQGSHGLTKDGIVGPATWRALNN